MSITPAMVLSAERGIDMPGIAGFRHSDTIVITEVGCELLTFYPRDLDSLIVPAGALAPTCTITVS